MTPKEMPMASIEPSDASRPANDDYATRETTALGAVEREEIAGAAACLAMLNGGFRPRVRDGRLGWERPLMGSIFWTPMTEAEAEAHRASGRRLAG